MNQMYKAVRAGVFGELLKFSREFPAEDDKNRASFIREFTASGVNFISSSSRITQQYHKALELLSRSFLTAPNGTAMLSEGGVYKGCWLESTGTISAEILSRFCPQLAASTYELFADYCNDEGLIPYKILQEGAAWRQIQMVSPLARSVWNSASLKNWNTHDASSASTNTTHLEKMYRAMSQNDRWLATYRNTLGTGCVEAFCTFDTGHDASSRFWHASDACPDGDPKLFDRSSPLLPFIAPDLTANVICQRRYLAKIALELGYVEQSIHWLQLADQALAALKSVCYDDDDAFYYDRDSQGRLHKIQSDVLLRVLSCEIADDEFFESSLQRYLLNTRKFFSKYPFTSIAMDDPRFDPSSTYNTWAGATNILSVIRAAHAFEYHGRIAEQLLAAKPMIQSFYSMEKFGQCINPWNGAEGYTEAYTPALLGLLDFTERFSGILIRPEGLLWFSGYLIQSDVHGLSSSDMCIYRRLVDSREFLLVTTASSCQIIRDDEVVLKFPCGLRIEADRNGVPQYAIGMFPTCVTGDLVYGGHTYSCSIGPNERLDLRHGSPVSIKASAFVFPQF